MHLELITGLRWKAILAMLSNRRKLWESLSLNSYFNLLDLLARLNHLRPASRALRLKKGNLTPSCWQVLLLFPKVISLFHRLQTRVIPLWRTPLLTASSHLPQGHPIKNAVNVRLQTWISNLPPLLFNMKMFRVDTFSYSPTIATYMF